MTASSPAPKPRRWRLQFSLRLLLLALTAFAIGFPIWYRWPYEETEYRYPNDDKTLPPEGSVVRTWQRTWGGGRVKSGREVDEFRGVGPRGASIKWIRHYGGGLLHGKFEVYHGDKLTQSGQYERHQREGLWVEYDAKGKPVCTANWHEDRLDGPFEMVTRSFVRGGADQTQMFVFSKGRLIDANGKQISARLFEQLSAGSIDDPRIDAELRQAMFLPMEFVETPLKDVVAFLQDAHHIPIVLDRRRVVDIGQPVTMNIRGMDVCSALTLLAAERELAFEYRYGVVRLTTAAQTGEVRDPTGVAEIRPPPGSPLARAWNEPCILQVVQIPLDQTLEMLGKPLAIGFDLTALPPDGIKPTTPVTMSLPSLPLKHALALLLDNEQLRCDARGSDTLVILPQK